MDRTELIAAASVILFVAFALGWFARWVTLRLSPIGSDRMDEVDRLAQSLHEAEEMRDQAIVVMEERERDLAQVEAELQATMEALREARQEVEMMQGEIERLQS